MDWGLKRAFRGIVGGIAVTAALAPAAASAQSPPDIGVADSVLSGTTIALKESDGRPEILDRVQVYGDVPIPGPGQSVTVTVWREGSPVGSHRVPTDPASGRYRMPLTLEECCDYMVQAAHGSDRSDPIAFEVEGPRELEPGPKALLFNRMLEKRGFHMGAVTDTPDESTALGIMALRKANDMTPSEEYAPSLFTYLFRGRGEFEAAHDDDGRHVEVDISRQVMALVEDGKVSSVFGISSGSGGTPRGEWEFYSKQPGYNAIGMYYSVFYDGDYATHGYSSVPTYPASHGCIRNPIPYSEYIYNWIDVGDKIYIYD